MTTTVFLSWSGDASKELAMTLSGWIPDVIQTVKPWFSPEDIAKGQFWLPAITTALKESKFGICCLTPGNVNSSWMAFEAGAMVAYQGDKERVSPVLLGLKPAEATGPYASLQHTQLNVEELKKLMLSINKVIEAPLEESRVRRYVDEAWPKLERAAKKLEQMITPADKAKAQRKDSELLAEVLDLVRAQGQVLSSMAATSASGALGTLVFDQGPQAGSSAKLSDVLSLFKSPHRIGNLDLTPAAAPSIRPNIENTIQFDNPIDPKPKA
jgi:hypothetical protein